MQGTSRPQAHTAPQLLQETIRILPIGLNLPYQHFGKVAWVTCMLIPVTAMHPKQDTGIAVFSR